MKYLCNKCNKPQRRYHVSCPECGAWGSLSGGGLLFDESRSKPLPLPAIHAYELKRMPCGNAQVDLLLGGGSVPGSSILLVGPPGAGKSTLLLQVLNAMNRKALYVSGEESVELLKIRAERLQINSENILLLFEPEAEKVIGQAVELKTEAVVIDSIQTIYTSLSDALPGSTTQIRKCTYLLRRAAQEYSFVLVIIGQVTKDSKAAGPKLLEHAVDVVLHLTIDMNDARTLFASKNRYGSIEPKCTLMMKATGLEFV
ncbi:MAG: AAA family ATPase [Bacteroidetes bacterium]|nr:AAA family ATPase [Bacteroidota bacterium]MCW5896692.1 AAA family ATPase [Bacteroidota bacterium]